MNALTMEALDWRSKSIRDLRRIETELPQGHISSFETVGLCRAIRRRFTPIKDWGYLQNLFDDNRFDGHQSTRPCDMDGVYDCLFSLLFLEATTNINHIKYGQKRAWKELLNTGRATILLLEMDTNGSHVAYYVVRDINHWERRPAADFEPCIIRWLNQAALKRHEASELVRYCLEHAVVLDI